MISCSSTNFEEENKNIILTFSNNVSNVRFWVIAPQSIPHINIRITLLLNDIY